MVTGLSIAALGIGATFVTAFTASLTDAEPAEGGLRSALVNTFHELGGAAVAVLSSAVGVGLVTAHLGSRDFARAFVVGAVCAAVSLTIAVALVPAVRRIRRERRVGCHIDAYEQAKWFGDDLALKGDFRSIDATGTAPLKYLASRLGAGRPLLARARMGVRFVAGGHGDVDGMLANHWYAADTLARRLGLGQEVCDTIGQTFERWDGKGIPHGTKGEDLSLPARIVALADVVEVYHRTSGDDGAVSVARERSGPSSTPRWPIWSRPRRRCCSRIWTWPPAGGP